MSHCAERHPELIEPYLQPFVDKLDEPNIHNAVKRNVMRVLQDNLPEQLLGQVATKCFDYISDPAEAIAVKAFSLTVLDTICKREPDLKNELLLLIKERLPYETPAFKSRAKKILVRK